MKLRWLGHSCFEIELDNGKVIVTDPYDDTVGYPPLHVRADCVLSSHGHFDHNYFAAVEGEPEILTQPGSYEVCGAKITGVPSWHDDAPGDLPDTPEQAAAIGGSDVLLIPIGGNFTIDTPQAVSLIERHRPVAAIAMHYRNRYCGFPVTDCAEFKRLTGAETLPNRVELFKNALVGCYVMDI